MVVNDVLGPVVAIGETDELPCKVEYIYIGIDCNNYEFVQRITFLSLHESRNRIILDKIVTDLKNGHYVCAVLGRTAHFDLLREPLEKLGYKVGILNGQTWDRKDWLQRAKQRKFDVILAQRRVIRFGVNIPPLDVIHLTTPQNNPHNTYQEVSRVRTPYPGKEFGIIRDYIDVSGACWATKSSRNKVYTQQKFTFIEGTTANKPKPKGKLFKGTKWKI